MQTVFGANIGFSMRTFHFKTERSSIEQQQTLACNLHLDPVDDVPSTEPGDCSCYSATQCSEESSEESTEESKEESEWSERGSPSFEESESGSRD